MLVGGWCSSCPFSSAICKGGGVRWGGSEEGTWVPPHPGVSPHPAHLLLQAARGGLRRALGSVLGSAQAVELPLQLRGGRGAGCWGVLQRRHPRLRGTGQLSPPERAPGLGGAPDRAWHQHPDELG